MLEWQLHDVIVLQIFNCPEILIIEELKQFFLMSSLIPDIKSSMQF